MQGEKTIQRVGSRGFRQNLSKYLNGSEPVAITSHGQALGYYIPAGGDHTRATLSALKAAAARLEAVLKSESSQAAAQQTATANSTPLPMSGTAAAERQPSEEQIKTLKLLSRLRGRQDPEPEIIDYLDNLIRHRGIGFAWIIERLERWVSPNRIMTPAEVIELLERAVIKHLQTRTAKPL